MALGLLSLFEFLRLIGEVAHELALPRARPDVHTIFYVSMLREYVLDESHVLHWNSVRLDESLAFEDQPIATLDMQVRKLMSKEIPSVKVQSRHHPL